MPRPPVTHSCTNTNIRKNDARSHMTLSGLIGPVTMETKRETVLGVSQDIEGRRQGDFCLWASLQGNLPSF